MRLLTARQPRFIAAPAPVLLALMLLAGCTGSSAAPPRATPSATALEGLAAAPSQTASRPRIACEDGRLLIGDLPQMDNEWRAGVSAAEAKARAWHSDAKLTSLRVGCQLFEPGFRWQATFYSPSAQAYFLSDTSETQPAEVAPEAVPTLPADAISFGMLRHALAKSGYSDDDELSPSTGVDLRVNTETIPFGPSSAPRNVLIYHVAVERRGQIRDVFVGPDGTIYRYTAP